mgnify:CR=1 FL=1
MRATSCAYPLCSSCGTSVETLARAPRCATMTLMETIKRHDTGPAVEDVQQRLVTIGLLDPADVDGAFGDTTAEAVQAFCGGAGLPLTDEVTEKVWAALVDASFTLGDRTLYLRMPHFRRPRRAGAAARAGRARLRLRRHRRLFGASPSLRCASSSSTWACRPTASPAPTRTPPSATSTIRGRARKRCTVPATSGSPAPPTCSRRCFSARGLLRNGSTTSSWRQSSPRCREGRPSRRSGFRAAGPAGGARGWPQGTPRSPRAAQRSPGAAPGVAGEPHRGFRGSPLCSPVLGNMPVRFVSRHSVVG